MNPLYVAGYTLGAVASARLFYTVAFEIDYKDSIKNGLSEKKSLEYAKHFGFYFAWAGLLWPIAWPALFIAWFVTRPTGIERDIEKRKAEEKAAREFNARVDADMIRLRNHFKSMDMESPDTATLRKIAEDRVDKNEDIDY